MNLHQCCDYSRLSTVSSPSILKVLGYPKTAASGENLLYEEILSYITGLDKWDHKTWAKNTCQRSKNTTTRLCQQSARTFLRDSDNGERLWPSTGEKGNLSWASDSDRRKYVYS